MKAPNGIDTGVIGEDGRPDIGHAIKIMFELLWLVFGLVGVAIVIVAIIK